MGNGNVCCICNGFGFCFKVSQTCIPMRTFLRCIDLSFLNEEDGFFLYGLRKQNYLHAVYIISKLRFIFTALTINILCNLLHLWWIHLFSHISAFSHYIYALHEVQFLALCSPCRRICPSAIIIPYVQMNHSLCN